MTITTKLEYEDALKELSALIDNGTETGLRYFDLSDAIEQFEDLRYPIETDWMDNLKKLVEGVEIDLSISLRKEDE